MSFVLTDLSPWCLHFSPMSRSSYRNCVSTEHLRIDLEHLHISILALVLRASEYTLLIENVLQAFCHTLLRLIKVG